MENKPREFWLDICTPYGDPCDFIHTKNPYEEAKRNGTHPCVSATNIHVVEYTALTKANAIIEVLEADVKEVSYHLKNMLSWIDSAKEIKWSDNFLEAQKLARQALESVKELRGEK